MVAIGHSTYLGFLNGYERTERHAKLGGLRWFSNVDAGSPFSEARFDLNVPARFTLRTNSMCVVPDMNSELPAVRQYCALSE